MTATDTTLLAVPPWLSKAAQESSREEHVQRQSIPVNVDWWRNALVAVGCRDEMFTATDGCLRRDDLFELGARVAESGAAARQLLWACLAWGTGRRVRNNRARIAATMADTERTTDVLLTAAELAATDPVEAYRTMRPGRNAIAYLGPPYFTKFLYFAGAGRIEHPSLILDSVVAESLRSQGGWTSLTAGPVYVWPSATYGRYCELLRRWADELTQSTGSEIGADQLEQILFAHRTR